MSEKCGGGCRATSCFAHGRRLVMGSLVRSLVIDSHPLFVVRLPLLRQ